MTRKIFLAALFLAMLLLTSYSAYADDAKPAPGDTTSPQSVKASYFQGIWSGSWPGFMSPTTSQDVTINIGQETREKIFVVTYSWGAVTWSRGFVPGGRIRTEGREQDDKFHWIRVVPYIRERDAPRGVHGGIPRMPVVSVCFSIVDYHVSASPLIFAPVTRYFITLKRWLFSALMIALRISFSPRHSCIA